MLDEFVRVSEELPCPICGKHSWCLIGADGKEVICQRVESPKKYRSAGFYHEVDLLPPPQSAREQPVKMEPAEVLAMAVKWAEAISEAQVAQLARQLKVPEWSLRELRIGWRGDAYTFPMRDADGRVIGVRFRDRSGRKWTMGGSRNGLFIPVRKQATPPQLIVEGPTDCAAVRAQGFSAIARPDARGCEHIIAEYLAQFEGVVGIVADRDSNGTGLEGAKSLQRYLPRGRAVVLLPKQHKDVREYYAADRKGNSLRGAFHERRPNSHWDVLQ